MKKILVSGCANCPYFIAWNDGEGNGFASISSGECRTLRSKSARIYLLR